jgi:hypothetical protein
MTHWAEPRGGGADSSIPTGFLLARRDFSATDRRSWDEHGNFRKGKIKPRSDRKFKVRLSREPKQDWEDTIELWLEEILEEIFPGTGASGKLTGYEIKGKCNKALTEVKVSIWATFVGSAGAEQGTAEYFGQMTADLN